MESKRKNCYAIYFSDFSQKAESKSLTFGEKSVAAAKSWKALEESEKNKYINQSENNCTTTSKTNFCNEKQHLCTICGRNFKAAFRLRFHQKTCGIVHLECPTCQKNFKTRECLQKHIRFVHNKEKLYSCPKCEKQFICRADLKVHFNIHEGVRFKCENCDSTFSNISNKNKHKKKNH